MDHYPNSYKNSYKRTKEMPPLRELAKKLESEMHGVESEGSKGKDQRMHEQEGAATKFSGQGAGTKPRPQKTRVRHAERVESILQQYRDEMGEQYDDEDEEEKDTTDYPGTSERNEHLPRKRTFQEAELSHSDGSESGALNAERNRRNASYTSGQPGTKGTSSGPKRWPARDSNSELDSGRKGSEAPSLELGVGNEDPWQGPSKSPGKGK